MGILIHLDNANSYLSNIMLSMYIINGLFVELSSDLDLLLFTVFWRNLQQNFSHFFPVIVWL